MVGLIDGPSDSLIDFGVSAVDFVAGRFISVQMCPTLSRVTDLSWLLEWQVVYGILGQRAPLKAQYV